MKLRSVRFKITVLYTAILGLILLSYSAIMHINLASIVTYQIDASLKKKMVAVTDIIRHYSQLLPVQDSQPALPVKRALHLDEVEEQETFQWPSIKRMDSAWKVRIQTLDLKEDHLVIYYPDGQIVEKSPNVDSISLEILKENFQKELMNNNPASDILRADYSWRVLTEPYYENNTIKYFIQLATPTQEYLVFMRGNIQLVAITLPLFLLIFSFLGRFLVIRSFEPIKKITETAKQITHKDMQQRVELTHADEEIKSLVDAFNGMILRLDQSFRYIEEFGHTVAHELKTPLAIIRGELEVALRKERSVDEYKKSIAIATDEAERILRTVNDLLLLAKLDYRSEIFTFERIDLNDLISEVCQRAQIFATEKKIDLSTETYPEPLPVQAVPLHLRRLFLNLLDNAVKYTPEGGHIHLLAQRVNSHARIEVTDTGVGISAEDLPKIFDRFYHVDRFRQATSTSGLGLSIAQSIAKFHNGRIEVKSIVGHGSTFTIILPLIT